MTARAVHPLAEDYLRRLGQSGRHLPPDRLRELLAEIEGHLSEALPPDASDHDVLEVLERLGPPGDIVEAEQPSAPGQVDRRSWREWTAVILLPLGGFALGIGWLVGLILLWSSRLWTTRDKLIGTLIVPGGLALAPVTLLDVSSGQTGSCSGFAAPINPATGAAIGRSAIHCTSSPGPSAATTALQIALVAFLVLGPLVSAVYLARRAGGRSPTLAASTLSR
jgi:hypothetical protein